MKHPLRVGRQVPGAGDVMLKRAILLLAAFAALFICVRLTDVRALDAAPAVAQSIPDTLGLDTKAKAAVVLDAATGRVLFAKNANARLPMASTTKIMSTLLTLEQDGQDEWFTVDPDAIRVEGSSMGLRAGDRVTLSALAYGMMLPSGNDAANAAAVRIAGSKEAFARMMNERAGELGMEDSHFVTPSGLDDNAHYSSAYDMALLTREALSNPRFAEICSQKSAKVCFGNPPADRWLSNHNRLLKLYPDAAGVKTGFTDAAGRCLVSYAQRGGVRLIVVTLNCPDDWNEHIKLYEHYFGALTQTAPGEMIPAADLPVTGGTQTYAAVTFEEPEPVALLPGERLDVTVTAEPFLYAPVQAGDVVGHALFSVGGQPVADVTLTAADDVAAVKGKTPLFTRLFGG